MGYLVDARISVSEKDLPVPKIDIFIKYFLVKNPQDQRCGEGGWGWGRGRGYFEKYLTSFMDDKYLSEIIESLSSL